MDYIANIQNSGLSIYDGIGIDNEELWIPSDELERLLNEGLVGKSLDGLALRTRSKVVKELVCTALGYPIPRSFVKTNPRFPGQDFDTYVQKANNLQIWNEEISPSRRYALIRVDEKNTITRVKVVDGIALSKLDKTGTLTKKHQASLVVKEAVAELIAEIDTAAVSALLAKDIASADLAYTSPTDEPSEGKLLPIAVVFERLTGLIGKQFKDAGIDQERNRGGALHQLVSEQLGFKDHKDDGQFPDIRSQLLEVKLQTSPTIDLGVVCPNSEDFLASTKVGSHAVRHCDVRYVLFYGHTDGVNVTLTNVYLTTGESFFSRFPQFQGQVINSKLQIPLPADFFTS